MASLLECPTSEAPSYPKLWRRTKNYGASNDPDWSRTHGLLFPPTRITVRLSSRRREAHSDIERFNKLVTEWKASVKGQSFAVQIAMHPSYQNMIGMGEDALPFIFERLKAEKDKPGYWFWALASITEENPVPKESRGRITEMANAWLNWGRERGYVKLG